MPPSYVLKIGADDRLEEDSTNVHRNDDHINEEKRRRRCRVG